MLKERIKSLLGYIFKNSKNIDKPNYIGAIKDLTKNYTDKEIEECLDNSTKDHFDGKTLTLKRSDKGVYALIQNGKKLRGRQLKTMSKKFLNALIDAILSENLWHGFIKDAIKAKKDIPIAQQKTLQNEILVNLTQKISKPLKRRGISVFIVTNFETKESTIEIDL